jgi:hypothetical protein
VQQDEKEWDVRHTYSDFRKLRDDVHRVVKETKTYVVDDECSKQFLAGINDLSFPARRIFGSRKDHVVKERAIELHQFLIKLLFLTHSYRKAQKSQYPAASRIRNLGSTAVFYILRDFLKPIDINVKLNSKMSELDLEGQSNSLSESSSRQKVQEQLSSSSNLIKPTDYHPIKSSESLNTLFSRSEQHSSREPSARKKSSKTLDIANLVGKKHLNDPPKNSPERSDSSNSRPQNYSKYSSKAKKNSRNTSASQTLPDSSNESPTKSQSPSKNRNATRSTTPKFHSVGSDIDLLQALQQSYKNSMDLLVDENDLKEKKTRDVHPDSVSTDKKDKKKKSRLRHRNEKPSNAKSSQNNRQSTDRLTRLSRQLTAQSISIDAQKQLEKYLSEYRAIMILRYVDRFISKAVTKTPGCYTVSPENRLFIDSERFYEELEETFPDLPTTFEENFKNTAGEWTFPPTLDAYVQMKWSSFQGGNRSVGGYNLSISTGSNRNDSDSDVDSDSEYEYTEVAGRYTKKKSNFTQEEADVLQEMIANGTAGKDQILRLHRQQQVASVLRHDDDYENTDTEDES